jgi:hypothetical protein
LLFDLAELIQAVPATALPFRFGQGWRRRRTWAGRRLQADLADVEVFLKSVQLEEVGEFEGADVAAAFPDFPLEIGHNAA